ncbi:MAG: peptide chain release factor N(5)-glutamine methyltransferase [Acidimicrobiales bacterium]
MRDPADLDGVAGSSDGVDELEGTITWRALLAETEQRLQRAGVADASISARRIIEEASGFEGAGLAAGLSERATTRGVARLDQMVERRSDGEPLQYVVGRWGFRHLDLMVDRRVLIPRPETEIVAERALAELRRLSAAGPTVAVDLGTGSGALGLSLAREHATTDVWITDVSADALDVARANLAGLGRYGSRVRVAEGWWFAALPIDLVGQIAVIVSNPPYVAVSEALPDEVADWEPQGALIADADGFAAYEVLIGEAPRWLMGGGALVLESAPHQVERLGDMASAEFVDVEAFRDLSGRPRGIVARTATGG